MPFEESGRQPRRDTVHMTNTYPLLQQCFARKPPKRQSEAILTCLCMFVHSCLFVRQPVFKCIFKGRQWRIKYFSNFKLQVMWIMRSLIEPIKNISDLTVLSVDSNNLLINVQKRSYVLLRQNNLVTKFEAWTNKQQ